MNSEAKIRYLEMIQAIISRMAQNSFLIKAWSITIISAIFVLSNKDSNPKFIYTLFFPVLSFWILDAYFLWQERLFRRLYSSARQLNDDQIDFNLDTTSLKENESWLGSIFSKILLIFYPTLIIVIAVIWSILLHK